MDANIALDNILKPKSVAVIGASTDPFKWGHMLLNAIMKSGFKGPIYPINPRADEILGIKCYSSVKDIGEPRYPSFMGIRKASRANIPEWTLADLGADPPSSVVTWPEVMNPPVQEVTNEIVEGDSTNEIAEKLADKIIEEKVL